MICKERKKNNRKNLIVTGIELDTRQRKRIEEQSDPKQIILTENGLSIPSENH